MEEQSTKIWQLGRRETIALILVVCTLVAVNAFNLVRRARARHSCLLIVEQGNIKLSLNAASAAELTDVPRIGPVLARRIIEYRERRGGFRSLEQLKEIKGIGDNTYRKICPYLELRSSD